MKIAALHLIATLAIAPTLAAQSTSAAPQDSATFDADGTAHLTRIIPMPATISPEAQKWLESLVQQKVGPPESLAERRARTLIRR
jgi:monoterpene epsilon-lactone hydrolase